MRNRRFRRRARGLAALTALAAAGALAVPAVAFRDDLVLVSRGAPVLDANSSQDLERPDVSQDGRFVLFTFPRSGSGVLSQVYVRDLATGALDLASREPGAAGSAGDSGSFDAGISADGSRVAFSSNANNLSASDPDYTSNVFLRDRGTGEVVLVSRADGPAGAPADEASYQSSISPDGRYVAFVSNAANVAGDDNDLVANVYLRDVLMGSTYYVNRADGAAGAPPSSGSSNWPVVSRGGRYVAFESDAPDLAAGDNDAYRDVFVRDTVDDTTTLVSRVPGGPGGNGDSSDPSVSDDGRYVAFESTAANLSAEDQDMGVSDVFVWDRLDGSVTLVSRGPGFVGVAGNGGSTDPDISADGRYVTFTSSASNLSAADDDGVRDVFVRDLETGTTTLVSRAQGPAGAGGDADSGQPAISADGAAVVFGSDARNLSDQDADAVFDVFRREVLGPVRPTPPPVLPGPGPVTPTVPSGSGTVTGGGGGGGDGDAGTSVSVDGGTLTPGAWMNGVLRRARVTLNVGVAGGADPVPLRAILATAGGERVGSVTRSLGPGRHRIVVPLPGRALPGTYRLTVEVAGRTTRRTYRLAPPAGGVARLTRLANTAAGLRNRRVFPAGSAIVNVGFTFAVLPRGARVGTILFTDPSGTVRREVRRILGNTIIAAIRVRPRLRSGTWTVSLRIRGTVVSRTTLRVR